MNATAKILVVEDEKKVARLLKQALEQEGFTVDTAGDGEEAEALILAGRYDLLVLDILIPKKDGIALLRDLRAREVRVPVLMLTARTTVLNKVEGLDAGADDYLTKPYDRSELVARVRSLLRRRSLDAATTLLRIADLELDVLRRRAKRGGREMDLTGREYFLLEYFMRNPNKVLTRSDISERIWNYTFDTGTNVVDVYVNHLRSKIDDGFERKLIQTVRGFGYVLKGD